VSEDGGRDVLAIAWSWARVEFVVARMILRALTLSRLVAGVLVTESAVLGVYVKRLKREKKRGAGSSS
jgi:hypothetical protein